MAAIRHLLLIDASGFAYRAFHGGLKFPRYRSDGLPTGAILGFLEIIYRMLGDAGADPVSHAAAIFDASGLTFRHGIFPEYKANRSERDPELSVQLPIMRDAARALGLPAIEMAGWEADDILATLARMAVEAGIRVTIVSSDKDMGQLVADGKVEIVDPLANKRVLAADVEKKFGVPPHLVTDVQALSGDSVDNVHGVDGIGKDTAARLVRRLGSLDAIMAEAAKTTGYKLPAAVRLELRKEAARIPIYRQLVTLDAHVPLGIGLADLRARSIEKNHLDELLRALEAKERFQQIFAPPTRETSKMVDVIEGDPLEWHGKALAETEKKRRSPSHKILLQFPDMPQCGWYKRRLVKDGPWVPARIWREGAVNFETDEPTESDILFCRVGDTPRNPVDQWGILVNNPISKTDYDFMMERREWVQKYAPNEPEANEGKAIDWNKVPI